MSKSSRNPATLIGLQNQRVQLFFLWSYIKSKVYPDKSEKIEQLKKNFCDVVAVEILENLIASRLEVAICPLCSKHNCKKTTAFYLKKTFKFLSAILLQYLILFLIVLHTRNYIMTFDLFAALICPYQLPSPSDAPTYLTIRSVSVTLKSFRSTL